MNWQRGWAEAKLLSWGVNPLVHGITQEQLSLVPSSSPVRKVKFTAGTLQGSQKVLEEG